MLAHDSRNWRAYPGNTKVYNGDSQLNEQGLPKYIKEDQDYLEAFLFVDETGKVTGTPKRGDFFQGKYVVKWDGEADVRMIGATYLSTGTPETGIVNNGRREYVINGTGEIAKVHIYAVSNSSLSNLDVYWADPADRFNQTLEGQIFHPYFLEMVKLRPWSYIRFMDWVAANASQQNYWSDRRLPDHTFTRWRDLG